METFYNNQATERNSSQAESVCVPERLVAAGFAVIAANGKRAIDQGWQHQRTSVEEVRRRFSVPNPPNAAILTGEASDNTVALDFDCPEAARVARRIMPRTGMRVRRASKPDSQWFYKMATVPRYHAFRDPLLERGDEVSRKRAMMMEVRGGGRYSVVHGVHDPSDERIEVVGIGERAEVADTEEFLRLADMTAAVAWLSRYWSATDRHNAALRLAGALWHAGYRQEDAECIIETICDIAGDEEAHDRLRAVSDTYARGERGEGVTGWRSLSNHFDERGVKRLVEWLRLRSRAGVCYPQTDAGNAEMFAEMHADRLRYNHATRKWLVFRRHWWEEDTDGEVVRLAIQTAKERQRQALEVSDLDAKKREMKWATDSESERRLKSMLAIAQNLQPLAESGEGWNADPLLLGVTNGVVDLYTGELLPGSPEQKISLHNGIEYDKDAECARWLQFLSEVFEGEHRADLIDWLRRYIYYTMTGLTANQSFIVSYGTGSNGKSTLFTILRQLLGPYAHHTSFSTLQMLKRAGGGASTEIAALRGKRLVTAIETNEGVRLDEALVKALTGGDPITARHLYEREQTFVPACTIWLAVNHKPVVHDDSHGFWRRVRLVPFTRRFEPDAEPDLEEKLRAELPGILAWAVRAGPQYRRLGLTPPEVVRAETEEYRQESDPLKTFIDTWCATDEPSATTSASDLYRAYRSWADSQGMLDREAMTSAMFGRRMSERFRKVHDRSGAHYLGVALVSERLLVAPARLSAAASAFPAD